MTKSKHQTPEDFFYDHAGYSYGFGETEEQGRRRCAKEYAQAEREASEAGIYFRWDIDQDTDSSDWHDDTEPYAVWMCAAYSAEGEMLASCGGIDFGPGGEPWGEPCRRVMEAELAQEALAK